MGHCTNCGSSVPEGAFFCPNCGNAAGGSATVPAASVEKVLGVVMFTGNFKDICFTDRRVIQFEIMRDRWKFLVNASLGPRPLVIDRSTKIEDVLPFVKAEIPRSDISSLEVKDHGRARRGYVTVVRKSGARVELARLNVDIDKESFGELVELVGSIYPEISKSLG